MDKPTRRQLLRLIQVPEKFIIVLEKKLFARPEGVTVKMRRAVYLLFAYIRETRAEFLYIFFVFFPVIIS